MNELNASRALQHVNVFSGQHLIGTWNPAAGKVYYAYSDWLGTKRYEADGSGTYVNSWTSLPFGDNETALGTGPDATEHHFTGKEHDVESGLDYFKARYYQSQTGRWLLPDWSETPVPVPYASFTNPQSLNLYTYVGNNPVNAVDADGHVQNGQDGSSRTGEGVTQPQACGTQNADAVTSNNSVCVVVQDGTTTPTASPSQAAANNQVNQSNEAPAQQTNTPAKPQTCQVDMPTGTQLTMVQTLMGEQTPQSAVGTNQYADDESGRHVGAPGGAEITNATLDREANLMAGTMLNLGNIGNSKTYEGLPAGITKTAAAEKSAQGSAACTQLQRDVSAARNAKPSAFSQWRAVNQGFIRERNGATRVAGTDFF